MIALNVSDNTTVINIIVKILTVELPQQLPFQNFGWEKVLQLQALRGTLWQSAISLIRCLYAPSVLRLSQEDPVLETGSATANTDQQCEFLLRLP